MTSGEVSPMVRCGEEPDLSLAATWVSAIVP